RMSRSDANFGNRTLKRVPVTSEQDRPLRRGARNRLTAGALLVGAHARRVREGGHKGPPDMHLATNADRSGAAPLTRRRRHGEDALLRRTGAALSPGLALLQVARLGGAGQFLAVAAHRPVFTALLHEAYLGGAGERLAVLADRLRRATILRQRRTARKRR